MQTAKKINRLAMYIIATVCTVITLAALTMNMLSKRQMVDLVKVIDSSNGREISSDVQRRKALLKSTLLGHVDRTIRAANSFTRNTIKQNQKRTRFLMDRDDANTIFARYKSRNSYRDAIQQGHQYRITKIEVTHLDLDHGEPYRFRMQAKLVIKDGSRLEEWRIIGTGQVTYHDPIYPQNEAGLWIDNYAQQYEKIQTDE